MHNLFSGQRFITSTVGSFPQPEELRKARANLNRGQISNGDYQKLVERHTLEWLTLQENLDIDVLVSGEFERQDMAVFFGEKFSGTTVGDFVPSYENRRYRPVIYEKDVRWVSPIALPMYNFVSQNTKRLIKETVTGPATLFDWGLQGGEKYYYRPRELRKAIVRAIKQEIKSLKKGGIKILQLDEPAFATKIKELQNDCESIAEAVRGFEDDFYLILHVCYSTEEALEISFPLMLKLPFHQIHMEMANREYALVGLIERHGFSDKDIGLGVIDVHKNRIETVEEIIEGIKKILPIIPPEKIWITPDCGLKERSKEVAIAKLKVMAEAAVRARELF